MIKFLILLILISTPAFAENVKVSVWKDAKGAHVKFWNEGITLSWNTLAEAKEFLKGNGGDVFEQQAREIIRAIVKSDTNLATAKNGVTFVYEDPKAVEAI